LFRSGLPDKLKKQHYANFPHFFDLWLTHKSTQNKILFRDLGSPYPNLGGAASPEGSILAKKRDPWPRMGFLMENAAFMLFFLRVMV
jgi:hypothetical protein